MLENRIKRLAYEQHRAQKLTDTATQKAEKLLEARERHQKYLQDQLRQREQRAMEEERLRIKNLSLK